MIQNYLIAWAVCWFVGLPDELDAMHKLEEEVVVKQPHLAVTDICREHPLPG